MQKKSYVLDLRSDLDKWDEVVNKLSSLETQLQSEEHLHLSKKIIETRTKRDTFEEKLSELERKHDEKWEYMIDEVEDAKKELQFSLTTAIKELASKKDTLPGV